MNKPLIGESCAGVTPVASPSSRGVASLEASIMEIGASVVSI